MNGGVGLTGQSPWAAWMSVWHSPLASMRTRTSPGPGSGIGRSLVEPVLQRADRDGVPAYLESSKERNIAFYARHGFEVTGQIHTPRGGPTLWLMWREPRPPIP